MDELLITEDFIRNTPLDLDSKDTTRNAICSVLMRTPFPGDALLLQIAGHKAGMILVKGERNGEIRFPVERKTVMFTANVSGPASELQFGYCFLDDDGTQRNANGKIEENIVVSCIHALWFMFNAFENAEIIEVEPRVEHKKQVTKVPGKRARTATVKLVTRRYEARPAPSGHTRTVTCERWGVRGHWRTYRNGTRVWIAPYEKGKGVTRKDTTYLT